MILTIITEDKSVYKDRKSFVGVDVSTVPANVRALQFDNITGIGLIEFNDGANNQDITVLPDWAVTCSNNYDSSVSAYEAEQKALFDAYQASKGTT